MTIGDLDLRGRAQRLWPWGWAWLLAGIGVALRTAQYFSNRSLSLDEASLALNVLRRDFAGLLLPLEYEQGAPIGFLVLERLVVETLGRSEPALRLIPFLAGIASVVLFLAVARRVLEPAAAVLAMGLFAVADPLIFFASDLKQYSSDVAVALALTLLGLLVLAGGLSAGKSLGLGLAGAAALWLSHPALFVLGGLAAALAWSLRHERDRLVLLAGCGVLWGASFLILYLVSLRELAADRALLGYWSGSFMPFPPGSVAELGWFLGLAGVFDFPVGLPFVPLAALCWAAGVVHLWRTGRAPILTLLAGSGLLALLASGLRTYPFEGRLLLFLVPAVLLLVAGGTLALGKATGSPAVGWVLVALLATGPLLRAADHLLDPRTVDEIRPVMSYLDQHRSPDQPVYVFWAAYNAYQYYAPRYGLDPAEVILGSFPAGELTTYLEDLRSLCGLDEVWLLFSHVATLEGVDEEAFFLAQLEVLGEQQDAFRAEGAATYLYDLGPCR
ncbi:MAG: hypothetical protein ACRD02_10155 [Acidimicrobiia bacterium]